MDHSKRAAQFLQEMGEMALAELEATTDPQELAKWHNKWLGRQGFFAALFRAIFR